MPERITRVRYAGLGEPGDIPALKAGEYLVFRYDHDGASHQKYLGKCLRCGMWQTLFNHTLTLKGDGEGTLATVRASVGCTQCRAHYWITDNNVEWLEDW